MKKAVVLLSGGLDSATVLYWAKKRGYFIFPLAFDYCQRHKKEISAAKKLARAAGVGLKIIRISLPWQGSSLLDPEVPLPQFYSATTPEIPSTYVPGRNLIFLAFGFSYAEAIGASFVLIGANSIDFSGYPDCRPQFFRILNHLVLEGTKRGVEGKPIKVLAPLVRLSKADIIRLGIRLKVPYHLTWSCYAGGKKPCGKCDSCFLRAKGFAEAGMADPLIQTH
ncbi:MAG: 7-cyano-7-deazaguanine synthase QueC [Candidatus Omnitrophota bacterium]